MRPCVRRTTAANPFLPRKLIIQLSFQQAAIETLPHVMAATQHLSYRFVFRHVSLRHLCAFHGAALARRLLGAGASPAGSPVAMPPPSARFFGAAAALGMDAFTAF